MKHDWRLIVFIISMMIIVPKQSMAQSLTDKYAIDSIQRALMTPVHDTIRVQMLTHLSKLTVRIEQEKSEEYAQTALGLAVQKDDKYGAVLAYIALANLLRSQGKTNDALEQAFRGLAIAEQLHRDDAILDVCAMIGYIYRYAPNFVESMNFYVRALRVSEKLKDNQKIATALNDVGTLYFSMGNYSRGLQFAHQALALKPKGELYGSVLLDLAITHQAAEHNDSSMYYYLRSEEIFIANDDQRRLSVVYNNIAEFHRMSKKFTLARSYYDKAMKACIASHDETGAIEVQLSYAQLASDMGDHSEAIRIAADAFPKGQKFFMRETLALFAGVMSTSYEALGNAREALRYARVAKVYEDSVKKISAERDDRLQAMLEFKQQLEENKMLREQANAQQLKTERQQIIIFAVAVGLVLAIGSLLIMYRTIVERKRVLTLLREQNEEIDRQKKSLEQANTELQSANTFKTDMLRMASHDLKNPLTSILGFSKILSMGGCDEDDIIDMSRDIHKSGNYMYKLILDLLDNAAAEMGKMEINPVPMSINALISMVVNIARSRAQEKDQQIIMDLQGDPYINADAIRLQQVLDNVVSNAVKYSPYGKRIWISTKVIRTTILHGDTAVEQDMVRCEVRDEGPGLTQDDKQKLFGHFQRLSAKPTGGESSTGVGLSIAKTIITLHGGFIRAESDGEGMGTTFIIVIPQYVLQEEVAEIESHSI